MPRMSPQLFRLQCVPREIVAGDGPMVKERYVPLKMVFFVGPLTQEPD